MLWLFQLKRVGRRPDKKICMVQQVHRIHLLLRKARNEAPAPKAPSAANQPVPHPSSHYVDAHDEVSKSKKGL